MSYPLINERDIIEALKRLSSFRHEFVQLNSKYGFKIQDLNHVSSLRFEQCLYNVLKERYPEIEHHGGAGKPDIMFPSFGNHHLEIKFTSAGLKHDNKRKSLSFQADVTSWKQGIIKDIIYVIGSEGSIDEFCVVRFKADSSYFHPASPGSRGKARMKPEKRFEHEPLVGRLVEGPRGGIQPIYVRIARNEDRNNHGLDEAYPQRTLELNHDRSARMRYRQTLCFTVWTWLRKCIFYVASLGRVLERALTFKR